MGHGRTELRPFGLHTCKISDYTSLDYTGSRCHSDYADYMDLELYVDLD